MRHAVWLGFLQDTLCDYSSKKLHSFCKIPVPAASAGCFEEGVPDVQQPAQLCSPIVKCSSQICCTAPCREVFSQLRGVLWQACKRRARDRKALRALRIASPLRGSSVKQALPWRIHQEMKLVPIIGICGRAGCRLPLYPVGAS